MISSLRRTAGRARWQLISAFGQKNASLAGESIVSFTFDDFPRSALQTGGAILKTHQCAGTYYTAMGLMDHDNHQGLHFCKDDLLALVRDGHELASHTFSHSSGRTASISEFLADAVKGRSVLEEVAGETCVNFSYPFGHATLRSKPILGRHFASCRGIVGGVNTSPADLNLLKANSIYSHSYDESVIANLVETARKSPSWLIFYTHDVREKPSSYGCTPGQFESVVKLVVQKQLKINTIQQVVASLTFE
jgi:peptidoglycan/xylan/chitin deacetylase (PgdA/CDA1 family)